MTRPGRRKRADSRYAEQAQRLAQQLRSLRGRAGLSQEQLAARAEVSVATVSKIETGVVREPGYFTVVAMLDALNAATFHRRSCPGNGTDGTGGLSSKP